MLSNPYGLSLGEGCDLGMQCRESTNQYASVAGDWHCVAARERPSCPWEGGSGPALF
jgi:hypothetical protein